MYSLYARDHFNCSPLLFSWLAPLNRCGQTEGGYHNHNVHRIGVWSTLFFFRISVVNLFFQLSELCFLQVKSSYIIVIMIIIKFVKFELHNRACTPAHWTDEERKVWTVMTGLHFFVCHFLIYHLDRPTRFSHFALKLTLSPRDERIWYLSTFWTLLESLQSVAKGRQNWKGPGLPEWSLETNRPIKQKLKVL